MATEDFLPALDAATGHRHEVKHVTMGDDIKLGDLRACSKCGKPVAVPQASDQDTLCPTCFAVLVNSAGAPLPGSKPLRLTTHRILAAEAVAKHGQALPVLVYDGIVESGGIAELLSEEMAANPAGVAALYAQAKEHGLLVMIVVQPAMKSSSGIGRRA